MMDVLIARRPDRAAASPGVMAAGAVLAAALTGLAVAWWPPLALLPVAALGGALLLTSARFRLVFVVFGGLATLQSSQDLDLTKAAYLAGTGVALGAAVVSLSGRRRPAEPLARPLLGMSLLWFAAIVVSLGVAAANGTALTAWLRDAAPYALFAAVPLFALDAEGPLSTRQAVALFVAAGCLASVSFAVEWLNRRDLADLGLDRVVLPSGQPASALFCYAVARSILGERGRARWTVLSAAVLALFLATATRGTLLILVAPPAVVMAAKGRAAPRWMRLAVFAAGLAVLAFFGFSAATQITRLDGDRAVERLSSVRRVVQDPGSDPSYSERAAQTRAAWEDVRAAPLLGQGPGHPFHWVSRYEGPQATFTIDSSLSFAAKFGLMAVAMLGAAAVALGRFVGALGRYPGAMVPRAALVGYAVTWLVHVPLSLPFEDKGAGFGLLFLLLIGLLEAKGDHHA